MFLLPRAARGPPHLAALRSPIRTKSGLIRFYSSKMAARYFSLLEPSPLLALLSVPSARLTCNGGAIRELAAPLAAKTNVLSGLPLGSSCVLRVSYTLVRTPVASSCVTFVTGKTLAEVSLCLGAQGRLCRSR
jgi:hypothetical protein